MHDAAKAPFRTLDTAQPRLTSTHDAIVDDALLNENFEMTEEA
jgi:hypothetical protein